MQGSGRGYGSDSFRWRVNPLIAEGLDNLKEHFAQRCANALQHVRYGIVDRLTDPNGEYCCTEGQRTVKRELRDEYERARARARSPETWRAERCG